MKKLYTEEQIRKAFMDGSDFVWDDADEYNQGLNEYIKSVTPITLPSDEEILARSQEESTREYKAFQRGAKYVINLTNLEEKKGGNK